MKYSVTPYLDASGDGLVCVEFEHELSESDPRPEFNLQQKMPYIRRLAKKKLGQFLGEHYQTTSETLQQAIERCTATCHLALHKQGLTSYNTWTSITFKDC